MSVDGPIRAPTISKTRPIAFRFLDAWPLHAPKRQRWLNFESGGITIELSEKTIELAETRQYPKQGKCPSGLLKIPQTPLSLALYGDEC